MSKRSDSIRILIFGPLVLISVFVAFQSTIKIGFDFELVLKYILPLHNHSFDHSSVRYILDDFTERGHFYRPIKNLFIYASYQFWELDYRPYKIIVVFFHFTAGFFLFGYLRTMRLSKAVSVFSCALFLLWYPSLRPVFFLNNSEDVFCGAFMLAALYFYGRSRTTNHRPYYLLSLLAASLAFSSKESSLITPLLIALDELFRSTLDGIGKDFKKIRDLGLRIARLVSPFCLIVAVYWILRLCAWSPVVGYSDQHACAHSRIGLFIWFNLADYLITCFGFLPDKFSQGFKSIVALIPLGLFFVSRDRTTRLLICFFCISLAPFLNLSATPYRIYFSTAILCSILAFYAFTWIIKTTRKTRFICILICLVLIVESTIAHRNITRFYANIINKTALSFDLSRQTPSLSSNSEIVIINESEKTKDSKERKVTRTLNQLNVSHLGLLRKMYFGEKHDAFIHDVEMEAIQPYLEKQGISFFKYEKGALIQYEPVHAASGEKVLEKAAAASFFEMLSFSRRVYLASIGSGLSHDAPLNNGSDIQKDVPSGFPEIGKTRNSAPWLDDPLPESVVQDYRRIKEFLPQSQPPVNVEIRHEKAGPIQGRTKSDKDLRIDRIEKLIAAFNRSPDTLEFWIELLKNCRVELKTILPDESLVQTCLKSLHWLDARYSRTEERE